MASGRRTATRSCAQHYDATDLAPKRRIKQQLLERLKLAPDVDAPLIGVVSRLVEQKGIDLLTLVLPALLQDTRASFAVLGNGDAAIAAELRAHRRRSSARACRSPKATTRSSRTRSSPAPT